ncbi:MAG: ABC transporter permease [Rubrivivax sp.]|nr:ABC transporter permease [Rubrivivax sp.]MDP3221543.1 ABC transporter permease [Rubrivivax sp.]MDP3614621.1 ABC transporter permease [Rubrivivax sp.]
MLRYLIGRLATALAVTLTLSVVTFVLLFRATDPASAIAGADASAERVAQVRAELGLDRPLAVQYGSWLADVAQGDLGTSWYWKQPVQELLAAHAWPTVLLSLAAVAVTVLVALPLGVAAALRPNSWIDRLALAFAVAAQALPTFWLGLVLIVVFALQLAWLPVSGDTTWQHYVLPAVVLGLVSVPAVMRLTRTGLLEAMASDYVRTARAKGVPPLVVMLRHALRNAVLPVVAVLAVQLGNKLGGSVVTESVFAINGLGRLALQSVLAADLPTVQMLVFVFALIFIVLNMVADLLNAALDPRVRIA